jgi:hypothetical protein
MSVVSTDSASLSASRWRGRHHTWTSNERNREMSVCERALRSVALPYRSRGCHVQGCCLQPRRVKALPNPPPLCRCDAGGGGDSGANSLACRQTDFGTFESARESLPATDWTGQTCPGGICASQTGSRGTHSVGSATGMHSVGSTWRNQHTRFHLVRCPLPHTPRPPSRALLACPPGVRQVEHYQTYALAWVRNASLISSTVAWRLTPRTS